MAVGCSARRRGLSAVVGVVCCCGEAHRSPRPCRTATARRTCACRRGSLCRQPTPRPRAPSRTSFPRVLLFQRRALRSFSRPRAHLSDGVRRGESTTARPPPSPPPAALPLLLLPPSGESRPVSAKPTSWQRAPPSASVSSETRSASSVSTMCLACGRECLGGAPIPGSLPYALGAGSPTPREGEPTGDARPLSNVRTCSQQCQGMGRLGSVGSGVCSHTPRVGGPGP